MAGLILGFFSPPIVKAQFFFYQPRYRHRFSVGAKKKGFFGGSVGITHPIPLGFPKIGFSTLAFEELEEKNRVPTRDADFDGNKEKTFHHQCVFTKVPFFP
ncbi:MAG: hypothetical protein Ct9H90mP8_1030 [Pseudomonadota bacterium]|nr:MAG: hypothetical protein Ct9H90mP8_1030 [Pseudomonadota bacterium]